MRAWTSSVTESLGSGCPRASTWSCGNGSGVPRSRGHLGTCSKVLKDFTRACVYTRDYRDVDDLRRVLTVLRELGIEGWIDYKRDCDTARGLCGRGVLYWFSQPGTVNIEAPKWSVGREMDHGSAAPAPGRFQA